MFIACCVQIELCCLHVYCLLFIDGVLLFTCLLFVVYRWSCVVYMFIVCCVQMELCCLHLYCLLITDIAVLFTCLLFVYRWSFVVYMFIVCLQMGLCCLHVYYLFTDGAVLAQCTFDQGATCGFNQDTVDTFNWVLGSGAAGGSGISFDKSQGTSTGKSERNVPQSTTVNSSPSKLIFLYELTEVPN